MVRKHNRGTWGPDNRSQVTILKTIADLRYNCHNSKSRVPTNRSATAMTEPTPPFKFGDELAQGRIIVTNRFLDTMEPSYDLQCGAHTHYDRTTNRFDYSCALAVCTKTQHHDGMHTSHGYASNTNILPCATCNDPQCKYNN